MRRCGGSLPRIQHCLNDSAVDALKSLPQVEGDLVRVPVGVLGMDPQGYRMPGANDGALCLSGREVRFLPVSSWVSCAPPSSSK